MKSVRSWVFLVRILGHSDWISRYAPYLYVFSPNTGICGAEKLRIWTLFMQCKLTNFFRYYGNDEDIQEDWELQGFVNEISADGNESNGGKVCFKIVSKSKPSFCQNFPCFKIVSKSKLYCCQNFPCFVCISICTVCFPFF